MAEAIRSMRVRGAPAIGAAAGFGLALAASSWKRGDLRAFVNHLEKVAQVLAATRPTAVNLFWAIERILRRVRRAEGVDQARRLTVEEACAIAEADVRCNMRIGQIGSTLIKHGMTVQTHCNTGSLATVWYGTALGVIYRAWQQGKKISVIVDETRPRLQGARLTAWELSRVGIPFRLVADSACGYLMARGVVDLILVGADRIAANGDVANKIGTYTLAIVAREHAVPFYVVAPTSTIDFDVNSGKDIPIEERCEREVLLIGKKLIAPRGTQVLNPAFDITPAGYVSGIVTEFGIFKPAQIAKVRRFL
jgi:methylthioribose-1-phosphate isomerase